MRIGIDLGGTNLCAGVVDESGAVLHELNVETPTNGTSDEIIDAMTSLISKLGKPEFVGVGSPGLIDHAAGIVRSSPNLPNWSDVPLKSVLEERLNTAVKVANDVNAMAWGELKFGAGRGCEDLLCITLGTGLGGGLIIDGALYTGKDDAAGEIGHVPLYRDGIDCACGNRGCVEQYVAKDGIVRRVKSSGNDGDVHTPETIAVAASRGEEWAIQIYDDVAADLGHVLAGMIQMFNFEKIVVGGNIALAGKVLFDPLKKHTREHVYPFLRDKFTVEPSQLGSQAGMIGAAFLE